MASTKLAIMIMHNIVFFGSGLSWVLALGQMSLRERSRLNYLLALYLLLVGGWLFLGACVHAGLSSHFGFNVYADSVPCYFLTLPLMYFYFKAIVDSDYHFGRRDLLHFLLPVICTLLVIPSFKEPVDQYQAMN